MSHNILHNLPPKVGIFDSGIGGISILMRLLSIKVEEIVYVADTAYLPYGQQNSNTLKQRGKIVTQLLINQGIDTIIVACHTSSATSLDYLQKKFPHITFVDMIMPTILAAKDETEHNTVGVIATPATIKSGIHRTLFKKQFPDITVHIAATPQLVPFIENQQIDSPECFEYLKKVIHELLNKNIDTLILGCTHYPFIEPLIKRITPQLKIVSAAYCIKHGHSKKEKDITFFVSGDAQNFEKKIDTLLHTKNYLLKKF